MITVVTCTDGSAGAPALQTDLEAAGLEVVGTAQCGTLVRDAIRSAPDVVVCFDAHPGDALFEATLGLQASGARPVVVFTTDVDAERIDRALASGIHAYVVNGYGLHRLRSVIHVAQARFRQQQVLRGELTDVTARFEERKLVDRAKGILMRARQISEEDAFRILRTASMHTGQRVGQVARQVIDAAHYAEAVNRAGQLRMLTQRLVKLWALGAMGVEAQATATALRDSAARVDDTLERLGRSLSRATFGDLLDAVLEPWRALRAALAPGVSSMSLERIDAMAEHLLGEAEQLTLNLESAGLATSLHVINVAGRQRMLSQRLAKQALLAELLGGEAAAAARLDAQRTRELMLEAFDYLDGIPLSTPGIRQALGEARQAWDSLRDAIGRPNDAERARRIAQSSEALLAHFERLTDDYERSMQMLMG